MKKNLKFSEILSIGFLLFAIFFGAGNVIFPPLLGSSAGTNVWTSMIGFIIADVGLSLICIVAVALSGEDFENMARKISPKFATFFSVIVYLTLGPLCVIPRIGATSSELSVIPLVAGSKYATIAGVIFIALFFVITYALAANPSKLLDLIGKIITPALLIIIAIIVVKAIISPIGTFSAPTGDYATMPFFKGFIDGYQTLDCVGALVISLVVINSVKQLGIKEPKNIAKNTILSGIVASIFLILVYFSLGYIGASSAPLGTFSDGGKLLVAAMQNLFGKPGLIMLGLVITLACLTTSIGLASSFAEYFSKFTKNPEGSYKKILMAVCIFSFVLANLGLSTILSVSLPVLLVLYPVTIVLIFATLLDKVIPLNKSVFVGSMLCAFIMGLLQVCESYGISMGILLDLVKKIPLYSLGIGWVIPSILGGILGSFIPCKNTSRG